MPSLKHAVLSCRHHFPVESANHDADRAAQGQGALDKEDLKGHKQELQQLQGDRQHGESVNLNLGALSGLRSLVMWRAVVMYALWRQRESGHATEYKPRCRAFANVALAIKGVCWECNNCILLTAGGKLSSSPSY